MSDPCGIVDAWVRKSPDSNCHVTAPESLQTLQCERHVMHRQGGLFGAEEHKGEQGANSSRKRASLVNKGLSRHLCGMEKPTMIKNCKGSAS